jgi:riboflavin synthase
VPEDLLRYIAEKASIAIDGVSLTVARWHPPTQGHAVRRTETQEQGHVEHGIADIAVIPFTYSHTSVRALAPGSAVNLEVDILAKYVESLLDARKSSPASRLAISKLLEEGF